MNQVEFEKRRAAMVKAINAFSENRTIKVIDLIEILLKCDPSDIIVLPGCLIKENLSIFIAGSGDVQRERRQRNPE